MGIEEGLFLCDEVHYAFSEATTIVMDLEAARVLGELV